MENSEYTDVQHHEGRRAGIVISVRLKPDEAELLRALSERDGRTLSDTLRIALHAFARQPRRNGTDARESDSLTRGGMFVNQPDLILH
ncbi:MAG: ribbon-helix-helix domain-containing protein [Solirubrobacteraceae bacterium]